MELIAERITEIKEKYRWCVVVLHGGEEFAPMPLPYTRQRYLKFLELGADVVVGHHPNVAENYELLENGKMIFYSLGNFIFDTDYQRAHLYTDIGILLKLRFTDKRIDFDAMGVKIDRKHKLIKECPLPDIFTEVPSEEYDLLAPLAARAFVVEDMKTLRFMSPTKYDSDAAFDEYFSSCNCQEAYVKGSHMDYDIILPISEEYKNNNWQNSKLENVKNYILNLL